MTNQRCLDLIKNYKKRIKDFKAMDMDPEVIRSVEENLAKYQKIYDARVAATKPTPVKKTPRKKSTLHPQLLGYLAEIKQLENSLSYSCNEDAKRSFETQIRTLWDKYNAFKLTLDKLS